MGSLLPLPETGTQRNRRFRAPHVDRVSRREFLEHFRKHYNSGNHVTLIGPTQRGKTTLTHQMLGQVISPERKGTILAGKPPKRDQVMAKAAKQLKMRRISSFPPHPSIMSRKYPNGYVLQPTQTLEDPDRDQENIKRQHRAALVHNYGKTSHPTITVVDEGYQTSEVLGLKKQMDHILMRGAPHAGLWVLVQRGRYMSYQIYDAPEFILIAYDPDEANQRRYAEIGGVDPRELRAVLGQLETERSNSGQTISQFLCIRRSGSEMLIVETK